jgi:glycosyltransferase involved in cell wall biosynthesis
MKLLLLINEDTYFLSHRLALALAAKAQGFRVQIATHVESRADEIRSYGFELFPMAIRRGQGSLRSEVAALLELVDLYRREKPDIVHHVSVKHAVVGTLAARIAGVSRVVNAVTGLGHVFTHDSAKTRILRCMVKIALRYGMPRSQTRVIVQNADDQRFLVQAGIVHPSQTVLIRGSGVDLAQYSPTPEPPEPITILLGARMLWDKGVGEFVEAARIIRRSDRSTRFVLAGEPDPANPLSIDSSQLRQWESQGIVEWKGYCTNMASELRKSHIVVLPSYREGLPKVLLEAAACGRPLIATDVPGCREIVRNGENGYLIPLGNSVRLADAICRLRDNANGRRAMGGRSREIVAGEFSADIVVSRTMQLYRLLLTSNSKEVMSLESEASHS